MRSRGRLGGGRSRSTRMQQVGPMVTRQDGAVAAELTACSTSVRPAIAKIAAATRGKASGDMAERRSRCCGTSADLNAWSRGGWRTGHRSRLDVGIRAACYVGGGPVRKITRGGVTMPVRVHCNHRSSQERPRNPGKRRWAAILRDVRFLYR